MLFSRAMPQMITLDIQLKDTNITPMEGMWRYKDVWTHRQRATVRPDANNKINRRYLEKALVVCLYKLNPRAVLWRSLAHITLVILMGML